ELPGRTIQLPPHLAARLMPVPLDGSIWHKTEPEVVKTVPNPSNHQHKETTSSHSSSE
ncbi:hypothetical protein LDENG_00261170, partial [Lucifuga dentata]